MGGFFGRAKLRFFIHYFFYTFDDRCCILKGEFLKKGFFKCTVAYIF